LSLRRDILLSFWIQGAGAVSVLAATLLLGATFGPQVQGGFNRSKAEIEFIAALALLGLPQALFFHVKAGRLGVPSALRFAGASVLVALVIGAGYAIVRHPPAGALGALLFGLAVAACVGHGQLRAMTLLGARVEWFGAVTALPQVLVLLLVGAVCAGSAGAAVAPVWWTIFALAFGVGAALAWRRLNRAVASAPVVEAGWRELARYGLAAWLTSVLFTAAVLVVQYVLERSAGPAALGQFTLAMTLVQVPLTPIAYAAPLLFKRWMERSPVAGSWRWARLLFGLLLGLAVIVWAAASIWPDLGMGPAYDGTTQALAVLLAGAAAEAASRLLAIQANASGLPWIAVRAELARWTVLAIGWLLPLPTGLLSVATVWALAAGAAALVFMAHARTVPVSLAEAG
jgi:hypothetical protein